MSLPAAVSAGRQQEVAVEVEPAGEARQRLAAYEFGVAARQMTFRLALEAAPQNVCHDETEHAVAKKFQPLVIFWPQGSAFAPLALTLP